MHLCKVARFCAFLHSFALQISILAIRIFGVDQPSHHKIEQVGELCSGARV